MGWFFAIVITPPLWAEAAERVGSIVPEANGEFQSPWVPAVQSWKNVQKRLEDRGIQFGVRYDADVFTNSSGGLRRGATFLGNLNLQLTVDAQRLLDWPGATVFLYGLGIHGGNPSSFAGDAQGVSNIAAPAKWTFEEAWFQQNLFDSRLSILAGRYDLNSEFYRLQSGGLFLNSSFGMGPEFAQSGQQGPSIFPNTSVGGRFAIKPVRNFVVRTAVLDGLPVDRANGRQAIFAKNDGILFVVEGAWLRRPSASEFTPRQRQFRIGRNSAGPYMGKLALGSWYYSASFDDLIKVRSDGQTVRHGGSSGFYVLADQTVYLDPNYPQRRITLFGQFGIGDPRVNRFAYYTGGGATVSALIAGRNRDELGLAVAAARNGNQYVEAQRSHGIREQRSEVAFELTYLAQLGSHLAVQPDIQFVRNPNADPRIGNALAFILRFEVLF